MDENTTEFAMICNCLYSMDNVRQNSTNVVVRAVVKSVGNWVGGTLRGFENEMVFSINKLNAGFQTSTVPLLIPYEEVRSVSMGRMMGFFKTVDVEMVGGIARFRGWGAKNLELSEYLRLKVAGQPQSIAKSN